MPMPALTELDPDAVAAALTEVATTVGESEPNLDLRPGPLADLVVYWNAVLGTRVRQYVEDSLAARSLLRIAQDPSLADADAVDDLLGNYRLERLPGSTASGTVTVVLSDDTTVVIASGSVWRSRGRVYRSPTVVVAKAEAEAILADTDRLIRPLGGGRYGFDLTLVAEAEGDAYNLKKGVPLAPDAVPPNFVSAAVATDFVGGKAEETSAELIGRLDEGLAARTPANRTTTAALLRADPTLGGYTALSVIGQSDVEMTRDRYAAWPMSMGGAVDWRLRTSVETVRTATTASATLVALNGDGTGTWQVALPRTVSPGAYEAALVRAADADPADGSLDVVQTIRGVDVSGVTPPPRYSSAEELAFGPYQTLTVRFTAPVASTNVVGDAADFVVETVGLPGLAYAQETYASGDYAHPGLDLVVLAPVPCFVTASLTLIRPTGLDDPDLAAVRQAVADVVNDADFGEAVYAAAVYAAVLNGLPGGFGAGGLQMTGRIVARTGEVSYVQSGDRLEAPYRPEVGVTSRVLQFFCSPDDVTVSVASA